MQQGQAFEVSPPGPQLSAGGAEVHLGNIWLIAAAVALQVLRDVGSATGSPAVLTVDEIGDMHIVGPEHVEHTSRLNSPGFACAAAAGMDVERLAQRLHDAALRAGR